MNRLLASFIVLSIALPTGVYAYSVETHRKITRSAVERYNACLATHKLTKISPEQAEQIESGNDWEDLQVPRKLTNWHFYKAGKDLGKGHWNIGVGSLVPRFEKLEKQLTASPKNFELMGALTHYIQDMTNPAHAAPIHHLGKDRFDNFDFSKAWPDFISARECDEVFNESLDGTYLSILDQMARQTLDRLNLEFDYKVGPRELRKTWGEAFWSTEYDLELSKQENFGHYGRWGNTFGDTTIGSAEIEKTEYENFARAQIHEAIRGTIQYFEKFRRAARD